MEIEATEVFEETWDAINEFLVDEEGNYILDEDGQIQRRYKYIIHEGSSRSSKTHSIIQCLYLYAIQNKRQRISVWRDTRKDCRDTVGFDMDRIYPGMPLSNSVFFRDGKGHWAFGLSKSVIELNGTDDENKVMGYNGDVAWMNEPYKISKNTFDQIDQRTTGFILIDWNPKKAHWIDDLKKDKRALVIHSTFLRNPFCPREQRLKILSYKPISMCEAVLDGMLSEREAGVYDVNQNEKTLDSEYLADLTLCQENENKRSASAYNWSVYGLGLKAEKPNRIFKWKKIPRSVYNEVEAEELIGVDWGKVDPFGIVGVKYEDGKLYCRQLNYRSENEIREKLTSTERAQISDDEEGLVQWFFQRLGISYDQTVICDPNRRMKIIALRQVGFDNALAAHKPPGSVKDGIDLLDALEVCYTEDSEDLQYEEENYSRKVDRYGIVMDEPIDADNHLIDPIRYVAQYLQMEGIIKIV